MSRRRHRDLAEEGRLVDRVEIAIRFSEVDALGIVWHGNFVKYLEDGREAFGLRYGLSYQHIYDQGWLTPIVQLDMDYRTRLRYGEQIIVETRWLPCDAAKIRFHYRIFRKSDNCLALEASSTQVFLNHEGELELSNPPFYREWKEQHGLAGEGSGQKEDVE